MRFRAVCWSVMAIALTLGIAIPASATTIPTTTTYRQTPYGLKVGAAVGMDPRSGMVLSSGHIRLASGSAHVTKARLYVRMCTVYAPAPGTCVRVTQLNNWGVANAINYRPRLAESQMQRRLMGFKPAVGQLYELFVRLVIDGRSFRVHSQFISAA